MKRARVSIIKDNMKPQTTVPNFEHDCEVGQWVDQQMAIKGHMIDHSGLVDMPEYGIDNKTRKKGSNSPHTIGSMTIDDIIDTPDWTRTRYYHKVQNQNQITWDPDFLEISKVDIVDMDIDDIQKRLEIAYNNL